MSEYAASLSLDIDDAPIAKAINALERLGRAGVQTQESFSRGSKAFGDTAQSVNQVSTANDNLAATTNRAAQSMQTLQNGGIAASKANQTVAQTANEAARAIDNMSSQTVRPAAGIKAVGASAKLASHELLNLSYQFQDLGVQLASGQNPITAMIQQGSQMSGVFATAGQRGIGFMGVLKAIAGSAAGLLAALTPVIIAVGALAAGFALFNREVGKNTADDLTKGMNLTAAQLDRIKEKGESTAVTMGDKFKATFQVIGDYAVAAGEKILNAFGTSGAEISKKFSSLLDDASTFIGNYYANVYGLFKGLFQASVALWGNFPKVIGDAYITALNGVYKTIVDFVNKASPVINQFLEIYKMANPLARLIPSIPQVSYTPLKNQFAGAAGSVVSAFTEGLESGRAEAHAAMDKFIQDVADQAEKNGTARLKKAAGKAGKEAADAFGRSLDEAISKFDSWLEKMDQAWDRAGSITRDGSGKVSKVFTDLTAKINAKGPSLGFLKGLVGSGADVTQSLETLKVLGEAAHAASESFTTINDEQLEAIKNQAALNVETQRYAAILDRAAQRQYDLSDKGRSEKTAASLTDAFDKFFEDIPSKGLGAFRDLFESVGDLFKDVWSDAMTKALDPFVSKLKEKLNTSFDKLFDKVGGAIKSALEKISPKLSGQLGSLSGKAIEGFAGYAAGQTASSALGGNKTAAQNQNAQIGAAVGAALGSIIPGIGTLLGSFIGTTLGGLLGPSSTNAAASSLLDKAGKSTSGLLGDKRTAETTQAINDFLTVLQSGYSSLKELGGTISTFVQNVEIGQRDPSKIDLSNGQQVRAAVGDTAAAQNAALIEVLRGTNFASDALNKIKVGMIGAGASFETVYGVLVSTQKAIDSLSPALSEWQQKLKTLDDTFKPLIETTGAYTGALKDAYDAARAALAGAFDKNIDRELLTARSQVAGQYADMLETQAGRIADVNKLGGDLADVLALNAQEIKNFVEGLSGSYSSVTELNKAFALLIEQAQKAGKDTNPLTDAYNKSIAAMRGTFDKDIAKAIANAANPTLGSLVDMLDQQKEKLAQAKALGANVIAVERLNAIETQNFFKALSDDQKKSLGDYLGIIEDYTGKIAVVLSKLGDELTARIDNIDASRNALLESASNLRSLADTIKNARDAIVDRYSPATPLARIGDLRTQFQALGDKAVAGDATALAQLPDLANKLIDLSRSLYGTTGTFGMDYKNVTALLERAQNSAIDQATVAEQQAQTLLDQKNLLVEIRDALQDSNPNLDLLANDMSKLVEGNFAVRDLLAQYLALQASQNGQTLSDSQLQALALLNGNSALSGANSPVTPQTQTTGVNGVVTNSGTQAAISSTATEQLLALISDQDEAANAAILDQLSSLNSNFRALSQYLKENIGRAA